MSLKLSARCIKVNGELINFEKTAELQIHGDTALECLEIIDGGDKGFTVIRSGAITDCPNLTTVICSKFLTHIDSNAFVNCPNLKEVIVHESIQKIKYKAGQATDITDFPPFLGLVDCIQKGC